jgi:enoyl-CoA hydratase/carnithine racemase
MPSSHVEWTVDGSTAVITLNRPEARNALTWEMYAALVAACDKADTDPAVRVLIIRGAGGAFAAGTDISQFRDFKTGDDGVAYERRLEAAIDRIEQVMKPTIAEVDGAAVGGGCAIAVACDFRICSDRARFGVPVARTLGNCLSITNTARLVDIIGATRVKDLMLTGRLVEANEALAIGLATKVVSVDRVGPEARTLANALAEHAPSTIIATKKMMLRLRDHRRPAVDSADDIIRECYGSNSFREGVAAFLEGRPPRW